MANLQNIHLRPMVYEDIPAAMSLKEQAGWNQSPQDWEMLLGASAGGCFVAESNQIVMGTITTITYQTGFSWLGMLLVSPAYRRQGIGTRLLQIAVNNALTYGPVWLDATPAGEQLYSTIGFVCHSSLIRLLRPAGHIQFPDDAADALQLNHLSSVSLYDTPQFGAQRYAILKNLYNRASEYAYGVGWETVSYPVSKGYCMGRAGTKFEHIGPVVADNIDVAKRLVHTVLAQHHRKPFIIDVDTRHSVWIAWLHDIGFRTQRTFTRMALGSSRLSNIVDQIFAIAGPEIG
ncbi:MAG: GNAT family N-acetyltransferase [Anaerolineae bacterium]|nr:GNAT family N-acetyltransferase [Anaerolineae bacterium]